MSPLVSIIIPVYNGGNYLKEAIDSALDQTYKNIEIIVINDGSNDRGETKKIALSYGSRIKYYEKDNGGVSSALNYGIRKMDGEFFSWLSHDDIYVNNKIELEVKALKRKQNILAVYSGWNQLAMPNRDIISGSDYVDKLPRKYRECGALAVSCGFISGCSLLISAKLIKSYGGFDEKYRAVQDYKLWFEMFHDRRIIYIPQKLILSRCHKSQVTNTFKGMHDEEKWLYNWMLDRLREKDVKKCNLSLYNIYGAYLLRMLHFDLLEICKRIAEKMLGLDEPLDIEKKINNMNKYINKDNKRIYLYCAGRKGRAAALAFDLYNIKIDGIGDSNTELHGEKCMGVLICKYSEIPYDAKVIVTKQAPGDAVKFLKSKGFNDVVTYDDIRRYFIWTPIYKKNIEIFLKKINNIDDNIKCL